MTYTIRTIEFKIIPDEVKSDKWRNLYFMKDGKSHLSHVVHESEIDAYSFSEKCIKEARDYPYLECRNLPGYIARDVSHAIQMPAKE